MVTRSYKLSPEFIALAVGACTLGLVFFALPYSALLTIQAPLRKLMNDISKLQQPKQ